MATDIPRLRTYIGIPQLRRDSTLRSVHLARVLLLLKLSNTSPIDKLLDSQDSVPSPPSAECLQHIFAALVAHTHRWRVVILHRVDRTFASALKGSLPLLSRLAVSGSDYALTDDRDLCLGYLPHAPKLGWLGISGFLLLFRPSHRKFPPLISLEINWHDDGEQIATLLRLAGPTLQHLTLHNQSDTVVMSTIHLPNLLSLGLFTQFFCSSISPCRLDAPMLVKLELKPLISNIHIEPPLRHAAATVTHLTLSSIFWNQRDFDLLSSLRNISHVRLEEVDDHARFRHLADSVPCIWPKLTSVIMDPVTVALRPGRPTEWTGDGILRLVRARNASTEPPTAGGSRPCKLTEVVLGASAPSWLTAEVARLLAM